jgi:hypothetical protein
MLTRHLTHHKIPKYPRFRRRKEGLQRGRQKLQRKYTLIVYWMMNETMILIMALIVMKNMLVLIMVMFLMMVLIMVLLLMVVLMMVLITTLLLMMVLFHQNQRKIYEMAIT